MTIEDARRVLWFRTNRRPIGELLDEGYLTRSNLEWAAEASYRDDVKKAARVLLQSEPSATDGFEDQSQLNVVRPAAEAGPPISIGIGLEEARATVWPFYPYKGHKMGELLASRKLSLQDLAKAAETAREEKLRQAAVALMAVRMEKSVKQPRPPEGPLQVVKSGRTHAERREYVYTLLLGLIFGSAMTIWAVLLISELTRQRSSGPGMSASEYIATHGIWTILAALGALIAAVALVLYVFNRIIDGLDKKIEDYRKGREGEERVEIALREALDGRWAYFRNVVIPSPKRSDIDGILVGPPGVWALEVKTWGGEHRNIGDRWEYRSANKWKVKREKPGEQAKRNAIRLKSLLEADGIKLWIPAIVVWANPDSPLTIENQTVEVWKLDRLPDEVGNVWVEDKLTEATRRRIIEKLTKLCERQVEAQRAKAK
jgi:hypothetical protein